jgi:hypothetical protein
LLPKSGTPAASKSGMLLAVATSFVESTVGVVKELKSGTSVESTG